MQILSKPVVVAALLLCSTITPAAAMTSQEAEVRAATLFNLLKFTSWPESLPLDAPLRICMLETSDDLITAVRALEQRTINMHLLQTRTVRAGNVAACEVVITDSARLAQLPSSGVLTIGTEGFIDHGGMIGIVVADNRVRFEVNLQAMRGAGLALPAQVLQLAVRTRR